MSSQTLVLQKLWQECHPLHCRQSPVLFETSGFLVLQKTVADVWWDAMELHQNYIGATLLGATSELYQSYKSSQTFLFCKNCGWHVIRYIVIRVRSFMKPQAFLFCKKQWLAYDEMQWNFIRTTSELHCLELNRSYKSSQTFLFLQKRWLSCDEVQWNFIKTTLEPLELHCLGLHRSYIGATRVLSLSCFAKTVAGVWWDAGVMHSGTTTLTWANTHRLNIWNVDDMIISWEYHGVMIQSICVGGSFNKTRH